MTFQQPSKIQSLYADDAELHCSHPNLDVVELLLQPDLNNGDVLAT